MKENNTLLIRYGGMLVIILMMAIPPQNSIAQPTLEWSKRYNLFFDNRDDWPNDMAIDTLGNVYITGNALTTSRSNNYVTIKYNSAGVQQWAVLYDGPSGSNGIDEAMAIALDRFGNVYVTGHSERAGLFTDDYCTIKYNNSGVQQWVSRYSGPNGTGQHVANSIAVDNNGNIYVAGYSTASNGKYDYLTIKYNNNGDTLWTRRYNGSGNDQDFCYSMTIDDQSSVYITGRSSESNGLDCTTIKYNLNGELQWISRSNQPGARLGRKIVVDKFKNAIVCGNMYLSGPNGTMTVKYSPSGQILWEKIHNVSGTNRSLFDIKLDTNLNVAVTGWIGYSATNTDYLTIKYNPNGDSLWTRVYNGTSNSYDEATTLCIDKYNDIYVSGRSTGSSGYDFTTLKYSSSGTQLWVTRYPGGVDKILIDKNLNFYLTGTNTVGGTGLDIITLKYSQPVGIIPISNTTANTFKLHQNYPNPFNPKTKIKFELPKSSFTKLIIYDVLGRVVEILVNEQLNPGTYEVEWNAVYYPSGVYYYRLISNGVAIDTKKLILLK